MDTEEVVPTLKVLAKKEKDPKKRDTFQEIVVEVQNALELADRIRASSRTDANLSMRQRDALHELIKMYAREIKDMEVRNRLLREADRLVNKP